MLHNFVLLTVSYNRQGCSTVCSHFLQNASQYFYNKKCFASFLILGELSSRACVMSTFLSVQSMCHVHIKILKTNHTNYAWSQCLSQCDVRSLIMVLAVSCANSSCLDSPWSCEWRSVLLQSSLNENDLDLYKYKQNRVMRMHSPWHGFGVSA